MTTLFCNILCVFQFYLKKNENKYEIETISVVVVLYCTINRIIPYSTSTVPVRYQYHKP